ncbi:unnamed protein product [Sphagnum jensenii]|uniref:Uncharacterized protein n=1 Tax=Sphagnum jensenii TaxID=128206 RepID=A0ABP1BJ02_9BRYO
MIEHFLKWIELAPLQDYSSEGVAYAFFDKVFNRFGVQIKTLINEGMKFHGESQKLCEKALINHCTISQDHHKVDELASFASLSPYFILSGHEPKLLTSIQ